MAPYTQLNVFVLSLALFRRWAINSVVFFIRASESLLKHLLNPLTFLLLHLPILLLYVKLFKPVPLFL